MTVHEYLSGLLEAEKFNLQLEPEIKKTREEVEGLLRGNYGTKIVSVKYSGSIAKGTAIKSSADMDLAVHFKRDAFSTLKEMYNSVFDFLEGEEIYTVREQRVSIGLIGLDVDVVPGRRIDEEDMSNNDVHLYRNDNDTYIKTNIEIHKEHISNSNSRDIIKLLKIWRDRRSVKFKSFAVELLVIKALANYEGTGLANKFNQVLTYIKDNVKTVNLVDPANSNNNVADIIDDSSKILFQTSAEHCLIQLDEATDDESKLAAWKQVFKESSVSSSSIYVAPASGAVYKETQDWGAQPNRRHG